MLDASLCFIPLHLKTERQNVSCGLVQWVREEYRAKLCCHVLTRILTLEHVQSAGVGEKMKHCFNERVSWHLYRVEHLSRAQVEHALI